MKPRLDTPSPCKYRRESDRKTFCSLVPLIAESQDEFLTEVSRDECDVCSTFFAPSREEPNPVVASLVEQAADASGNHRLKEWTYRFHRIGLFPETVGDDGIVIRDKGELAREQASHPCFYLVRRRDQSFSEGDHRSGWPYAFDALSNLHCGDGIVLDDFIEQRFGYHMGAPGYREPWIGIFHHPLDDPGFTGTRNNLNAMLQTAYWREAEPWLRGVITLSDYLTNQLRGYFSEVRPDLPIASVKHPMRIPETKWSFERFSANPKQKLIQMGWYQRNTQAIYSVPPVPLRKYRVFPCRWLHEHYDEKIRSHFAKDIQRYECRVTERAYIHADEYEAALTENVMFSHIITASANNVVVDCIAANTPLIINPHPAVVELSLIHI